MTQQLQGDKRDVMQEVMIKTEIEESNTGNFEVGADRTRRQREELGGDSRTEL